jgi:hypothetical protein
MRTVLWLNGGVRLNGAATLQLIVTRAPYHFAIGSMDHAVLSLLLRHF